MLIDEYRAEDADELVRMWREGFEFGVGITDPHPLEEQARHLVEKVVPNNAIRVVRLDGRIVGFVAASLESIAQLYVRRGFHRRGIGSRLLAWAKAQSAGTLWLYTFAQNAGARAFYERHGFTIVARGHEPHWKLDDLRYEWNGKTLIRPIEPGDIDPVANLLSELAKEFIIGDFEPPAQQLFLTKNDAAAIRERIARGFRYHVAEMEGELAGFVGTRDNKHLYHLFVVKRLHRRGIGRMMWDVARSACEEAGHGGPFTVNSSNNSVHIYERWGFKRSGPMVNSDGVLYNPMKLEATS